jgi:hypothetical protein
MAQAISGKNITPVCTTLSVCIPIEQSHGSPESKECLGINIQDHGPLTMIEQGTGVGEIEKDADVSVVETFIRVGEKEEEREMEEEVNDD